MEAFWTRFQPGVAALYEKLHTEKVIGEITSVITNFSSNVYNVLPDDHRILGLEAAGGPLLDLGAYCMIPARIALTDNPLNGGLMGRIKPTVTAVMSKTRMGTDLATTIVLDYPNLEARAVCSMSHNARSPKDHTATISGTEGEIVIHDILCRITKFSVTKYKPGKTFADRGEWSEPEVFEYTFPGMGLNLEADAVARDIRGKSGCEGIARDEGSRMNGA